MSTELRDVTPTIHQTRFSGGDSKGPCLQVTQRQQRVEPANPFGIGYLQLTRTDAALLAAELLRFAAGAEVEEV